LHLVPPTPLFTQDELRRAFTLLLPPEHAAALAARWFAEFASSGELVDGMFVYPCAWAEPTDVPVQAVRDEDRAEWDTPEIVAADERTFRTFTEADAEAWFLRLGDLHLALVALVSPDADARLQQVRRLSPRAAARSRLQIERAVRAYRAARGWAAV
jgi:hypothetical protein